MDSGNIITLVWLVLGVLLVVGEIFIPGLVAVFLGAAAILVAGLRYLGIVEGLAASIFAWMGLSVVLTISLRNVLKKYLPADTSRGQPNEQIQAFNSVVEVLVDIEEDVDTGRIKYQGTTWPAISTDGTIPKGEKAKLVARQNLSWIVEPVDPILTPDEYVSESNALVEKQRMKTPKRERTGD